MPYIKKPFTRHTRHEFSTVAAEMRIVVNALRMLRVKAADEVHEHFFRTFHPMRLNHLLTFSVHIYQRHDEFFRQTPHHIGVLAMLINELSFVVKLTPHHGR